MGTDIQSNGSKGVGEAPDSIARLLHVLETQTLDRGFEAYGDLVTRQDDGSVRFFGNFLTVSHVFHLTSDDPDVVRPLVAAIRRNQASIEYQQQPSPRPA